MLSNLPKVTQLESPFTDRAVSCPTPTALDPWLSCLQTSKERLSCTCGHYCRNIQRSRNIYFTTSDSFPCIFFFFQYLRRMVPFLQTFHFKTLLKLRINIEPHSHPGRGCDTGIAFFFFFFYFSDGETKVKNCYTFLKTTPLNSDRADCDLGLPGLRHSVNHTALLSSSLSYGNYRWEQHSIFVLLMLFINHSQTSVFSLKETILHVISNLAKKDNQIV